MGNVSGGTFLLFEIHNPRLQWCTYVYRSPTVDLHFDLLLDDNYAHLRLVKAVAICSTNVHKLLSAKATLTYFVITS